jgi:hypothetical protein
VSPWQNLPIYADADRKNVFNLFVNSLAENGIFPDNLAAFSSLWQGVETGSRSNDIVAQLGIDLGSPNPFDGLMERLRQTPRPTDNAGVGSQLDTDLFRGMVAASDERVHKRARVDVEQDFSCQRRAGGKDGAIGQNSGVSEAATHSGQRVHRPP